MELELWKYVIANVGLGGVAFYLLWKVMQERQKDTRKDLEKANVKLEEANTHHKQDLRSTVVVINDTLKSMDELRRILELMNSNIPARDEKIQSSLSVIKTNQSDMKNSLQKIEKKVDEL